MSTKHIPTERESAFLDTVEDIRHEREIINGLAPFFNEKAPEDMLSFYTEDEVVKLRVLKDTERDIESRHAGQTDTPLLRTGETKQAHPTDRESRSG